MEDTYFYYTYDINLDDNLDIRVDTYGVDIETKMIDGKKRSSFIFSLLNSVVPDNVEEYIKKLKEKGFISYKNFGDNSFKSIIKNDPLKDLQISLLNFKHKLLEKVYDVVIIDNVHYIFTYLIYINVNTGKKYMINLGNLGLSNENLIMYLENNGYKSLGSSLLFDYIDYINIKNNKPLELVRKKESEK